MLARCCSDYFTCSLFNPQSRSTLFIVTEMRILPPRETNAHHMVRDGAEVGVRQLGSRSLHMVVSRLCHLSWLICQEEKFQNCFVWSARTQKKSRGQVYFLHFGFETLQDHPGWWLQALRNPRPQLRSECRVRWQCPGLRDHRSSPGVPIVKWSRGVSFQQEPDGMETRKGGENLFTLDVFLVVMCWYQSLLKS